MPKPHWTQTPEGKAKMSAIQKKAWANIRAKEEAAARRKVANAAARFNRGSQPEIGSPTIVIQGWRITVVGSQLRVERES